MKLPFLFLFLIFSLPIAASVGFSPSSLVYILQPNEQLCQTITLTSESETINVTDAWASSQETEWKISLFNTTAEEHNIIIAYPKTLSIEEREFNVCISGQNEGEYHGVIIMRQEQEGNSIIQLAVWLKVIIEAPPQPPAPQTSSGGGSSGGGGGGSPTIKPANQTAETEFFSFSRNAETPPDTQQEQSNNKITGAVINFTKTKLKTIIPVIFIALIIALSIYIKRRKIQ